MSDTGLIEKIETLTRTVRRLETRVEELEAHEDLRDLEQAIVRNADSPSFRGTGPKRSWTSTELRRRAAGWDGQSSARRR